MERDKQGGGEVDLEALEFGIRTQMLSVGGTLLERILNEGNGGYKGPWVRCGCGGKARFVEYRDKQIRSILGAIRVRRAYYSCRNCHRGQSPLDKALDVVGSGFSPGLRRLSSRVGAKESFAQGSEDLRELAGVEVETKEVERISERIGEEISTAENNRRERIFSGNVVALPLQEPPEKVYIAVDGTGVPVVSRESLGRRGKGEDGKARTREAKLGCVFTQIALNQDGRPVREESSTTYVGEIETAEEIGKDLYAEVVRRGLAKAETQVVLGDGAAWIWEIADEHFPEAIQILDLYHAREHLWTVGHALYPGDEKQRNRWMDRRLEQLNQGNIASMLKAFQRVKVPNEQAQKIVQTETKFFRKRREQMRYAYFRSLGLFVGSGVVEAGCKTVIGQRLKQSGMRWTVRGANAIISLRRSFLSGEWEDFWASRATG